MCVIVGVKLPRNPDGSPEKNAKWRLGKIRDRTYVPTFNVKRWSVSGAGTSQLFLVDQDTDWTEGCSVSEDGFYLGIVNAALNNKSDKKDSGIKKSSVDRGVSRNGVVLRQALKQKSLEDCVSILVDNRIDGNTFVTDGNRLFCLEIYIPEAVKEKYKEQVENSTNKYEDLVQPEEYIVTVKEINDHIIVRTNHGVFDTNAGYKKSDGDLYKSSTLRRKYTSNIIRNKVFQPIDLIIHLTRMSSDDIDDNAFFRPVRLMGIAKSKHSDVEIFSTATIMLDPSGTIFLRPIECNIGDISLNKLTNKKRKTNLVVLPSHIPLFETKNALELLYKELQENLDEITVQQRIQRSQRMRRIQSRLRAGRKRATARGATASDIKRRSQRRARSQVKRKFSRGGASPSEKKRAEMMANKRKALITRIAKRLKPKVRRDASARRSPKRESVAIDIRDTRALIENLNHIYNEVLHDG